MYIPDHQVSQIVFGSAVCIGQFICLAVHAAFFQEVSELRKLERFAQGLQGRLSTSMQGDEHLRSGSCPQAALSRSNRQAMSCGEDELVADPLPLVQSATADYLYRKAQYRLSLSGRDFLNETTGRSR
jgi:hypothetical protein